MTKTAYRIPMIPKVGLKSIATPPIVFEPQCYANQTAPWPTCVVSVAADSSESSLSLCGIATRLKSLPAP